MTCLFSILMCVLNGKTNLHSLFTSQIRPVMCNAARNIFLLLVHVHVKVNSGNPPCIVKQNWKSRLSPPVYFSQAFNLCSPFRLYFWGFCSISMSLPCRFLYSFDFSPVQTLLMNCTHLLSLYVFSFLLFQFSPPIDIHVSFASLFHFL